ncbi:hypothetical protein ABCS02_08600 [Microbacterium sp. X-17]|uniref:hypothetical protein n=1 Tax=Microbacterium sp. X-17 TaxID=3144404 RepID=UPI0031F58B93
MAAAHFVLVDFASGREKALAEWRRSAQLLQELRRQPGDAYGEDVLVPPVGPIFGWRLVAPNNRDLARSARFFGSEGDAAAAIEALRAGAARMTTRLVVAPTFRGFGWEAALDGAATLMCARWYEGRAIAHNAAKIVTRILVEETPEAAVPLASRTAIRGARR